MREFRSLVAALILTASGALRAETLVLVAGGGDGADGTPAVGAKLQVPFALGQDKDGNFYIPEFTGERIRKIDSKGIISTIGGTGVKGHSGDGGPAVKAQFFWMHNLIVAADGMIYVADSGNSCVRKIDPATGIVTNFAGTGKKGNSGMGGPATQAEIGNIYCVAANPQVTRLYLDDLDNKFIRVVDMKTGIISNFAGTGARGIPKDGADAATSPLSDPRAVTADANGNVYILERGGHALRVVDAQGKIRTVVGTGKKGFSGDGGDAIHATLAGPKHICIDLDGNVIIADTDNHAIRKYSPKDGKISLIAGTGKAGKEGLNGPPEKAQLSQPHGVLVTADGTLYIVDSYNNRVLKIQK